MGAINDVEAIFNLPPPQHVSALPVPNSTRSFWNTPESNPLAREGSEGQLISDADVCIIGSGITGVSAAYHLAKNLEGTQLNVEILEARDFCSGATGRNGGHLTAEIFENFLIRQRRYGSDEARKVHQLEIHTARELAKLIKTEGWEAVDFVSSHRVGLITTDRELEIAKNNYNAAKESSVDSIEEVEWLSETEMFKAYGTPHQGYRHSGNNLWPLKLVTQLYKLAKQLNPNLNVYTNTPVTAIVRKSTATSRQWSLSTPRGDVQCSYIIHATNGYTSHLLPHMHGPSGIVPTRGQVIALRASAPSSEIPNDCWVGTLGWNYWFPRPVASSDQEPLVILGGGRDESGPLPEESYTIDDSVVNVNVGKKLRNYLPSLFPGKYEEGREPEIEWTGIMGYTKDGDPFVRLNHFSRFCCLDLRLKVGPVVNGSQATDNFVGQYIAAGYTGQGMPRAYAW
ncbi:hypothetical protein H0H87_003723 [Tephrocybe sp. NHM501043]|nr:hypothetical protein H0H87_003723 [Tephrocybe sp. NHM501043]